MPNEIRGRLPYLLLVFLTLVSDRWTKALIDSRLFLNQTIPVIDGLLSITYVRNTGVAFGILDSGPSSAKSTALAALTVAAIGGVLVYSWRTPLRLKLTQVALSLILAGAVGNLYDRVRLGYVIDFIDVYYKTFHWPSFNIADSAITVGVALLALDMFRKDAHDPARVS
jgi:signal peptidase II